jgi:hypothetical protein
LGAKTRGNYPHYPNPEHCCEFHVFGSGECTCGADVVDADGVVRHFSTFTAPELEDRLLIGDTFTERSRVALEATIRAKEAALGL